MAPVKMPHSVSVFRSTLLEAPRGVTPLGVQVAAGLKGIAMVVIRAGTWIGAPQLFCVAVVGGDVTGSQRIVAAHEGDLGEEGPRVGGVTNPARAGAGVP